MTQAYAPGDVARLKGLARGALEHWGLPASSDVELINLSENATFLITPPSLERAVLRVGRPDYSSVREVSSELAWIEAIARDGVARTAPVLRALDDSAVVEIASPELPQPKPCVLFRMVPGAAREEDGDLAGHFRTLGGLAARLHAHARVWRPPNGFARRRWDYETTVGESGHWGSWRDAVGDAADERRLLGCVAQTLAVKLASYGTDPERFGLTCGASSARGSRVIGRSRRSTAGRRRSSRR